MKPKLNYRYTIKPKMVDDFQFLQYGVDEVCYQQRIIPHLNTIVDVLKAQPKSRQATITTNNNTNYACLLSIQFQIIKDKLIVTANFRSQCKTNGRPSDTEMLRYISTLVMKGLNLRTYRIYVNVGNYHHNESLTQENSMNEEVQRNLRKLK